MHKINVLVLGSKNFNTSLEELKQYLNFKFNTTEDELSNDLIAKYDILLFHQDYFQIKSNIKFLKNIDKIKILASYSNNILRKSFINTITLPMRIEALSEIIDNSKVKKNFHKNSSINIKGYILNKNEKKLIKHNDFIFLTEKEIQFLELLLLYDKQSISKKKILEEVWHYSSEADTHTVETHIYRLRKKIKSKFSDEKFILNNKDGYLL